MSIWLIWCLILSASYHHYTDFGKKKITLALSEIMQLYLYLKAKTSQDYYPKYTWLWFSGLSFSYWTIKPNSFGSCSCTTRNTRWIWCAASWGGNFVWWMMTKLALSHGLSHKTACTPPQKTFSSLAQWAGISFG